MRMLWLWGLGLALVSSAIQAYEPKLHQQLTFIAAKQYNACVGNSAELLTPLQVRYMARANVQQAQSNLFSRMFRWNYYDRGGQSDRSWMWLIDTRFHGHFAELSQRLADSRSDSDRFRELGRIINYVQTVTSPARAVPVYTGRWWRLSMTDRFDEFRLDEDAVAMAVSESCAQLDSTPAATYAQVLEQVASDTFAAVLAPIDGMPASWTDFWRPAKRDANFGDYGPAGNNFGEATRFRCENEARCVLLDNDPLYEYFALERHIAAVLGTMQILHLAAQEQRAQPESNVEVAGD